MVEVLHPETQALLTTSDIESPPYVDEIYGEDLSLLSDGKSHALGFVCDVGERAVVYIAPGHCHSPLTNVQTSVHESVSPDHVSPDHFRGPWESAPYE